MPPEPELIEALLPALVVHEASAQRCSTRAARRLDLGAPLVVLLELACHADAALEDLLTIAEARGIATRTIRAIASGVVAALRGFCALALLEPAEAVRATLGDLRRGLALAGELERAACAAGDDVLSGWCALFRAQRGPMLLRIEGLLLAPAEAVPRDSWTDEAS